MCVYSRTNYPYFQRRDDHQPVGAGEEFPVEIDAKSPDYPIGSTRNFQSRYCQPLRHIPSHCSAMAGTFSFFSAARFGKGCSAARPLAQDSSKESYRHCKCYPTYETTKRYPLEYPRYGKRARSQQRDGSTNMERAQSKTTSNQNIQTQQGQTLYRETLRCRRALSKSSRQGDSFLRRRKKPNTGAGTYSIVVSHEAGNPCQTDSRLHATRHDYIICGLKYARRNGNRRLYVKAPASGIYPISTVNQHQNPGRYRVAFNRGQLRNPQAPAGTIMAESSSAFSFTLYSYFKFLVEYDRAMVLRDYVKKNSSRLI